MIIKKHILLLSAFAVSGGSVFAFSLLTNNTNQLVKATPQEDYRNTLVFNAGNVSSGSGSVTVNGNTFNYTNITVDGNNLTFGVGATLVFDGASGETISGSGMVGGSFKSFSFMSAGACDFTFTLNDKTGIEIEAEDLETVEHTFNWTNFSLEITAGSFSTTAFNLKYDCVAPTTQRVLLIGEKDSFLSTSNYPAGPSYTSLMDSLGNNVVVDELIETTSRPTYTMAVLAKTSTNFYKTLNTMLNENEYSAIILQISPRCTPNSTHDGSHANTVEESEIAAIASLKTRLHQETNNIFVFAIQNADGNPYIWSNTDDLKYTQTENKETKTFVEMCEYYSNLSETMATAVDGKAMHFADCYSEYKRPVSEGGLGYSVNYPSLRYMYAHVMYATMFDRMVPAASTYKGENASGDSPASTKAMNGVKTVVSHHCIS